MHIPGSFDRQRSPGACLHPEEQRHGQGCGWRNECRKQGPSQAWPWDGLKLSHACIRSGSNPGLPRVTSRRFARALGRLRTGFVMLSPLQIACVFLHWERGRSFQQFWRSDQIMYSYHKQVNITGGTMRQNAGLLKRKGSSNSKGKGIERVKDTIVRCRLHVCGQ
jgi:hypothetical protein